MLSLHRGGGPLSVVLRRALVYVSHVSMAGEAGGGTKDLLGMWNF